MSYDLIITMESWDIDNLFIMKTLKPLIKSIKYLEVFISISK